MLSPCQLLASEVTDQAKSLQLAPWTAPHVSDLKLMILTARAGACLGRLHMIAQGTKNVRQTYLSIFNRKSPTLTALERHFGFTRAHGARAIGS